MRTLILLIIGLAVNAGAASWYLDNAASGSANGSSWANAWTNPTNVVWGVSGVAAGDTLYISGGSTSKTYTNTLTVGVSGTASNRIAIRVGQDAGHNGKVIFDGEQYGNLCVADALIMHRNFITVDGDVGGQSKLYIQNWRNLNSKNTCRGIYGNPGSDIVVSHCVVTNVNTAIHFIDATNTVIANCDLLSYSDAVICLINSRTKQGDPWNSHLVYSNRIACAWNVDSGGPDGIQSKDGVTAFRNLFEMVRNPSTNSANHTDYLQSNGRWTKFYENEFVNIGDSGLSPSPWEAGLGIADIEIYNNIFRITEQYDSSPEYIRMYNQAGLVGFTNVHILNNLFIDNTNNNNIIVLLNEELGNAPGTNNIVANNLFVNIGSGDSYVLMWKLFPSLGAGQSQWAITNNVLHSGPGNVGKVSYLGTVYATAEWMAIDASTRTNQPAFVSYTENSYANNFALQSSDTIALGRGLNFSSMFSTDYTGSTRPAQWSIGPFDGSASATTTNTVNAIFNGGFYINNGRIGN